MSNQNAMIEALSTREAAAPASAPRRPRLLSLSSRGGHLGPAEGGTRSDGIVVASASEQTGSVKDRNGHARRTALSARSGARNHVVTATGNDVAQRTKRFIAQR
jgi:hypothetical protein